jgi:acetyl-CoA C-acetyltransferase
MAEVLRADPGSYGLVSGVGMHMTKHVYGIYSTDPGDLTLPDREGVQRRLDAAHPPRPIVDAIDGEATVAAYSVVHGRAGEPEAGVLVCDVDGGRAYARLLDPSTLAGAEESELVGRRVQVSPQPTTLPTGLESTVNLAVLA